MDPLKTAVKLTLVPLRAIVQLGELYVGEPPRPEPQPERRPQPRPEAKPQPKPRKAARRPKPQASQTPKPLGDVAIARKVETVIFRDPEVPKGDIDVNVVDGVLWLRGQAGTPEMIKALEAQAAEIPEVKGVENLLHLPKTPAPTRTDTPPAQRKTRRTSPRSPVVDRPVETAVTNEAGQPSPAGARNGDQ
jgi:hypothetical protein